MKKFLFVLSACLWISTCLSQSIPADSMYLAQTRPGNTPVIFNLPFTNILRPVERIAISSDGKEIYFSELNNWPPSNSRIKCFKYLDNKWQGPFTVFERFICPGLSINDSIMYMQMDTNNVSWTYYSVRNSTGWSTPVKLLSTNNQTHYYQETQSRSHYLASTPAGNSDICKLVINNSDTSIQSLGNPINKTDTENDFFIAKDESYLIFFRLTSPYDLFVSYHKSNGRWTNPKSLGPNINTSSNYECCPYISADNKYLFFTRGGNNMNTYYTYWVKIDNIIDSLKHTNFAPYLSSQIPNITDTAGKTFNFVIPDSTFTDDDGNNTLTYTATLSSGGALPSWLSFNPATRTFYSALTLASSNMLKVTATDNANASVACYFSLTIVNRVSIQNINGNTVDKYSLCQNYPNPFNPVTKIQFSVPKAEFVTLKVYDILGKEVTQIFGGYLNAGTYSADFDAANIPSGIYFYTLETQTYNAKKKMVLLK